MLRQQGKFAEAVAELRTGHELGVKDPKRHNPSDRNLRDCERLLQLDARLPGVLQRKDKPADAAERIGFAQVCKYRRLYHTSAHLYAEAFAAEPALAQDLKTGHRYDAACYAALAGCGRDEHNDQLDDKERTRLRNQALQWLRADLTAYGKLMESGKSEDRQLVQRRLLHWQRDRDIESLRDPAAVAKMPAEQQELCRKLWSDVEALLAKFNTKRE